jgi:hypothetical protein
VLCLALLQRSLEGDPGPRTGRADRRLGRCLRALLDQPLSPVRQFLASCLKGSNRCIARLVRDGAALALVLALGNDVLGFVAALRSGRSGRAGPGAVQCVDQPADLRADGRAMTWSRACSGSAAEPALGILMPFLLPGLVMASALMIR